MGELLKQLRKENMQAMKDRDTTKKAVLGLVISAIALAEKESGKEMDKADELTFVQKELKQQRDSLSQTPESRKDLIEETTKKIEILESYLPKQLNEEEIKDVIEEIIAEKGLDRTKKSQGPIMKEIMAKYKGQVDGKTVNKVLATILQ